VCQILSKNIAVLEPQVWGNTYLLGAEIQAKCVSFVVEGRTHGNLEHVYQARFKVSAR